MINIHDIKRKPHPMDTIAHHRDHEQRVKNKAKGKAVRVWWE